MAGSAATHAATASHAGKTAPRLIQDLLTYDLRYEAHAKRNLLTSAPPQWDPDSQPASAVPARNCRHNFTIKPEQSVIPDPSQAHITPIYKIATICYKCRCHVDLFVDLREHGARTVPCRQSSGDYTLHHFLFQREEATDADVAGGLSTNRLFKFQCSAPMCPAHLRIGVRRPRLSDKHISTMTDHATLRRRLDAARELSNDRADALMARRVDALDFLSTYLSDSLKPQKGKSRIPLLNRKFLKTFGRDCDDILTMLGFTHQVEPAQGDEAGVEVWYLPQPPPARDPWNADAHRTLIEDVQHELGALIRQLPETERTNIRYPLTELDPALKYIERGLGCHEYQKRSLEPLRSASKAEEHPYYAGLGAVGDFSDALLLFAYTCQVRVDPTNAAYYFECLKDIAIGRNSELLGVQVQVLASQGQASRKEVDAAYRYLAMDPKHAHVLSDDHIIGQFRSRLQDISPATVEETRTVLRIIGHARDSDRIKQEASNAIETYGQALSWLDLDESMPDEYVITMYGVRIAENSSDRDIARRAVQIIADHRNSQALKDWLVSGTLTGTGEMDVAEAYAILAIQNRADPVDPAVLEITAQSFISDNPESKAKYEKAYELIKKDQEAMRESMPNGTHAMAKKYPLATWPVGCLNIGNTCYLNSVLQFLFTIKPLREVVLNCEQHFQVLDQDALQSKRVGRSAVTAEKVEKAQQFVQELRTLFLRLIHSNTESIRPETRLAALALAKGDVSATASAAEEHTGLGEIGGLAVAGPMAPPGTTTAQETAVPTPDTDMDNSAPSTDDVSSTVVEVAADNDQAMASSFTEAEEQENNSKPEQPSRPPPVPPRPQDIKKIEGLAEQQDAAEILNNVFDLLSCAFEGDGTLGDGEQNDFIKKLFFSDVTSVRLADGKSIPNSALQDNHLISPGNRDRPLYAALDDEFSLTELETDTTQENTGKTFKFEYITSASPVQIVNVRRLVFEAGKSRKDESHLGLDEVIYLDRYLERTKSLSKAELSSLRDKQWALQRTLKQKETRKSALQHTDLKASLPDVVDDTADYLETQKEAADENLIDVDEDAVPIHPDLHEKLRERANALRKEIDVLDAEMKDLDEQIDSIFKDCKDHPYRLHAVFMHRGGARGGHYWIYIYDFQNKIWRDYNDERVEEAEVKKVFDRDGNATSTGVVFVQADRVDELTEAVRRDPDPVPGIHVDSGEIEMKDLEDGTMPITDVQVIDGVEKE